MRCCGDEPYGAAQVPEYLLDVRVESLSSGLGHTSVVLKNVDSSSKIGRMRCWDNKILN